MSNPTAVTAPFDASSQTTEEVKTNAAGGAAPAAPQTPETPPEDLETLRKRLADTQAAFTKASQELAELKKAAPAEPPKKEEDGKPADPPKTEDAKSDDKEAEAIKEAAKTVDVDVEALRTEFFSAGDLSPESREKALPLAEQFFSNIKDDGERKKAAQSLLNEYIEGRKAVLARENAQFEQLVGGSGEYNAMIQWAGSNLSEEEANAFNRARNSGDYQSAALAVQGLHARYRSVVGRRPKLLEAAPVATVNDGQYSTFNDYVKDTMNPAYKKDPAFRAAVTAKLQRGFAG